MDLAIAEKREVATEIANTLSKNVIERTGYYECTDIGLIVSWAQGFLLKLADPSYFDKSLEKWNRDQLPMKWPVKFVPEPKTKKQLDVLGALLKKCNLVYNCTDIDNAGSWIFWSIYEHFKCQNEVKRVYINDNNLILQAWQQAKPGKEDYVNAMCERSRQILDQLVGFNVTRALTTQAGFQGWRKLLTAGRVQSFFVGLVVRRYLERERFTSTDYYILNAALTIGSTELDLVRYIPTSEDPVDEEGRLNNKDFAVHLESSIAGKKFILDELDVDQKPIKRPMPFDLGSLQSECDRLFGYSLSEVLETTQKLRDLKLITYNRTDSRYLSDESFDDAESLLNDLAEVDLFAPLISMTSVDQNHVPACFNSTKVSAHHAIIPTHNTSAVSQLNEMQFSVYYMIVRNYITQFLPEHVKEYVSFKFHTTDDDGVERHFKAKKSRQLKLGWKVLFVREPEPEAEDNTDDNEEENLDVDLSLCSIGGEFSVVKSHCSLRHTTPPPFFTITSLLSAAKNAANHVDDPEIKEMLLKNSQGKPEVTGVGTSATRTPILTELFKKGLLRKVGGKVRETEESIVLYQALPSTFTDPTTTAIWADQQSRIQDGTMSINEFMSGVEQVTSQTVHQIKQGITIPEKFLKAERLEECPKCHSYTAEQRPGKHNRGVYWHCPSCSKNFNDYQDKPFDKETMQRRKMPCPKCKGEVEHNIGKFGDYWKCISNSCGNFPDLEDSPFFELCPECNSELKIKTAKKSMFIGCSGYPSCTFTRKL
ncbi:topoisomerase DNA-binding C4 zinc finger domain-containing protein [Vibrio sp. Y2-5]|uniref:DNA topoisomerase n=1 Tax=Vibrio sp. Y2-5 TaxID=2743977 RepID=UPI0016602951|nr:DNA topoisomerase [Vibrio sp. Y2-5]MBD0788026.1 topoisomerase DNA-binding C4 zinc finger domain-containing protein [Vibrio sp. Y2-5]